VTIQAGLLKDRKHMIVKSDLLLRGGEAGNEHGNDRKARHVV